LCQTSRYNSTYNIFEMAISNDPAEIIPPGYFCEFEFVVPQEIVELRKVDW
jgi:hypothetical protein